MATLPASDLALAALLDEYALTEPARACERPAGAYANCLAVSALCAQWLRERGVECGLLHFAGSRAPFPDGSGRWPYFDPRQVTHWTVRVGALSVDWTARQFRPAAGWPDVEEVGSIAARWRLAMDWACTRCPQLVADPRHLELTPPLLERAHRDIARATDGRGAFPDPRHDDTAPLTSVCRCADGSSR